MILEFYIIISLIIINVATKKAYIPNIPYIGYISYALII